MALRLSMRLSAVASLVTPGMRLADIGTDHGYVPVWLAEQGRIPSAVAMDIGEGPLERARQTIRAHGLESRIETRLSDGMEALGERETQCAVIAGMGGALTKRILERSPGIVCGMRELILQPQSEISLVREYLWRTGWRIAREDIVEEEGKFYPMMKACPGETPPQERGDLQALYGPRLLEMRHPVLLRYLLWERGIYGRIFCQLEMAGTETAGRRRQELEEKIRANEAAIRAMESEEGGDGRWTENRSF